MTFDVKSARPADCFDLDQPSLERWGAVLGRAAVEAEAFVCLSGPLGAGKSTLVRAACRGAGIEGAVPSPTFTLLNRHQTSDSLQIWHADLYRLESPDLLVDAGWPELLEAEGAVFVEWAERAGDWLPPARWEVRIAFTDRPDTRRVSIRSVGAVSAPPRPGEGTC